MHETKPDDDCSSITKREYFAIQIMQAFCSSDRQKHDNVDKLSRDSVYSADELVKALNREVQK